MTLLGGSIRRPTIKLQSRYQRRNAYFSFLVVAGLGLMTVRIMLAFNPAFGAALLITVVLTGFAIVRPTAALGVAIFLAVIGDAVAMAWWPAVKNFSSSESALYISDGISINPLEIVLGVIVVVWLLSRQLMASPPPLVYGPFWPALLVFTASLGLGLVWGLARGGDFRVAIFELRPLVYVPVIYLVTTNLFTTMRHYRRLVWAVVVALTIEAVHGLIRLSDIREDIPDDASPVEHTAALHMNLVLVLVVATVWFGSTKLGKRPMLFVMMLPILVLYLDAERRAAVVGLVVGGMSLAVVLFTRNREKFRRIIPLMLLIVAVYSAAFWNSDSQAGFPAQAVKIIVQPDSSTEKDASSDLYREIENFNLNATIRSNPLLGIGFGQPFLQPIALPDISFFEFAAFIPHNSVLWMWTKVGFVGFVSFLYIFAIGVANGIRAATRMRDPDDAAMVAAVAAFIPMTLVVAFVDITFDVQTMVLFAMALALVGSAERLSGLPDLEKKHLGGSRSADAGVAMEPQP